MNYPAIRLMRKNEVLESQGFCKSTLYNQINEGLFTPPVQITTRNVAWPSNEVEAITKARIAGKADQEIKNLVNELVLARTEEAA